MRETYHHGQKIDNVPGFLIKMDGAETEESDWLNVLLDTSILLIESFSMNHYCSLPVIGRVFASCGRSWV